MRLAVPPRLGGHPVDAHERCRLVAGLEVKLAACGPLPSAERPSGEVAVGFAVLSVARAGRDEVRHDAALVERSERPQLLRLRVQRRDGCGETSEGPEAHVDLQRVGLGR